MTHGLDETLREHDLDRQLFGLALLARHSQGDWGDLCDEDIELNNQALKDGARLFSVYEIEPEGFKVWVITEWDRSATTLLLPREY